MNKGSDSLMRHAIQLSYYMRGAMQYKDVYDMTYPERANTIKFINSRMEYESNKFKKSKGKIPPIY
jgi:hypothetical protein